MTLRLHAFARLCLLILLGGALCVEIPAAGGVAEGERVRLRIPLGQVQIFATAEDGTDTPRLGSGTGRPPAAAMIGEGR